MRYQEVVTELGRALGGLDPVLTRPNRDSCLEPCPPLPTLGDGQAVLNLVALVYRAWHLRVPLVGPGNDLLLDLLAGPGLLGGRSTYLVDPPELEHPLDLRPGVHPIKP